MPHKFFNAQYGEPLRNLLSQGKHLSDVVHFGDQQIFAGATTYTCLLFLNKEPSEQAHIVKVTDLDAWRRSGEATEGTIPASNITAAEWNFTVGKGAALFEKLSQMPVKLGDIASNIFQGIVTSADPIYILENRNETSSGFRVYSKFLDAEFEIERTFAKPFIKDYTIEQYTQPPYGHVLLFPYERDGVVEWSDIKHVAPETATYLEKCKRFLSQRESGKMAHKHWFAYVYPKNLFHFQKRKLIVQVISKSAKYTIDETGLYFTGGGNGPYYGVLIKEGVPPEYILALLNSKLLDFYLHCISSPFRGGYWSYGKRFIEQLPVRTINFSDTADRARHDKMVALVTHMLDLHKQLAAAQTKASQELYQRQIDTTDRQIDTLVYELYGLNDEEIRIVEEAA